MRFLIPLLFVLCATPFASVSNGAEWLSRGDLYYAQRAVGASNDRADRLNALNTVNAYKIAMEDPNVHRTAGIRLLRALYFQGCFAFLDKDDRLRIFSEAKTIGEKLILKYPNDPDLAYWYSVNLSLWAKESGPIVAVRSGVAETIRKVTENATVRQKPQPAMAGVYQVLGRMHHLLPRIPFLLPWPNKEMAEKYLGLAATLDPSNLANPLFLAEFYRDMGRFEDARRVISPLKSRVPRVGQELEDRRNLWKLRDLEASLRLLGDSRQLAAVLTSDK